MPPDMGAHLQSSMRARTAPAALLAAATLAAPFPAAPALAQVCATAGGTQVARAAAVPDPRSVALADGRVLAVAGIESFAILSDDGDAAEAALRQRLAALVTEDSIALSLVSTAPDRYGRLPALIATADGRLVQEELAKAGLAIAHAGGGPLPCFAEILAAEDAARRAKRGFWARVTIPAARPAALQERIGRFAIFEGTVISVGNRRARSYLNFGGLWSEDVTVEIAAGDRAGFGGEAALAELAGRRVRVRGFLVDKAGPMMELRSPLQLEILGGVAAANGEMP
jgi:hypothetical protein